MSLDNLYDFEQRQHEHYVQLGYEMAEKELEAMEARWDTVYGPPDENFDGEDMDATPATSTMVNTTTPEVTRVSAPPQPTSEDGEVPVCLDHKRQMDWVPDRDFYKCGETGCKRIARAPVELVNGVGDVLQASPEYPVVYRDEIRVVVDANGTPYLALPEHFVLIDIGMLCVPGEGNDSLVIPLPAGRYAEMVKVAREAKARIRNSNVRQVDGIESYESIDELSEHHGRPNQVIYVREHDTYYGWIDAEQKWAKARIISDETPLDMEEYSNHIFHPEGSSSVFVQVTEED